MAKKEKKEVRKEHRIYIGKTLPGLSRYTVFKDGVLPEYVAKMAAESEVISGLIVPVSVLQEARKNIKTKGHILNYYANQQR